MGRVQGSTRSSHCSHNELDGAAAGRPGAEQLLTGAGSTDLALSDGPRVGRSPPSSLHRCSRSPRAQRPANGIECRHVPRRAETGQRRAVQNGRRARRGHPQAVTWTCTRGSTIGPRRSGSRSRCIPSTRRSSRSARRRAAAAAARAEQLDLLQRLAPTRWPARTIPRRTTRRTTTNGEPTTDPNHPWRRPLALSITGGLLILGLQLAAVGPEPPWAAHEPAATQADVARAGRTAAGHRRAAIRVPASAPTISLASSGARWTDRDRGYAPRPARPKAATVPAPAAGPRPAERPRPLLPRPPRIRTSGAAQGRARPRPPLPAPAPAPDGGAPTIALVRRRAGPRRTTPRARGSRAACAWPGSASCSRRRG